MNTITLFASCLVATITVSDAFQSGNTKLSLISQSYPLRTSFLLPSRTTILYSDITKTDFSSASRFSGAGPILVDMNKYNVINLEEIALEWTAILMPASSLQDEGVYLQAKTKQSILADTVKVAFTRIPNKSLGLQLLELAGGRDDGLGITVIEDVLEGGCAEGSGIIPGDSIIKVEVRKRSKNDMKPTNLLEVLDTEEVISIGTECLNYDKTVEAIVSLPPASNDPNIEETFILTLKRLRRKPKIQLKLQYPPKMNEPDISLELFAGENLRRALLVRGVKLNDPLSKRFDSGGSGDCGAEGTCATCAVSIVRGKELLNPPGSTEYQIFNKFNPRWRMSCKAIVGYGMNEGELVVRVNPKQWDDEQ